MTGQPEPEAGVRPPAGRLFARGLLIQAAWNFQTMLGPGFAWTLLPWLRRLATSAEDLDRRMRRHAEHFNAHPYLAPIATGAVARMEAEGADEQTLRRFKTALRGALGGLGDTLVWATWLPGVALLSLVLYWFGVPGPVAAAVFLVVYNAGHLALRGWSLRVGLREGRRVGARLAEMDLGLWTRRLQSVVTVLLGAACGALLADDRGFVAFGPVWTLGAAAAFVAGLLAGHRAWRPAAVVVVVVITFIGTWGVFA